VEVKKGYEGNDLLVKSRTTAFDDTTSDVNKTKQVSIALLFCISDNGGYSWFCCAHLYTHIN